MKSLSVAATVISWIVLAYVIYRIIADRCVDIPVYVEIQS